MLLYATEVVDKAKILLELKLGLSTKAFELPKNYSISISGKLNSTPWYIQGKGHCFIVLYYKLTASIQLW